MDTLSSRTHGLVAFPRPNESLRLFLCAPAPQRKNRNLATYSHLAEFFDDGHVEFHNWLDNMSESPNLALYLLEQVARMQAQLAQGRAELGAAMPARPDFMKVDGASRTAIRPSSRSAKTMNLHMRHRTGWPQRTVSGLRNLACTLAALGLGLVPCTFVSGQDNAPPNIVVILADDLGYGDLGAYGQKKIKTPRLDQMATDGTLFTSFYAGNTVCAPSRVALLTGTDMAHAHTRSNRGPGLREADVTIAEVLKEAGYATGVFGKWGFGTPETGAPDRQGFDEFLGYLGHVHAHSYYTDHLFAIQNGRTERVDTDSTVYTHDLFTEKALDFIERHQDQPFFLYLPFALVHAELLVPSDAMTPYQDSTGASLLKPEKPFPCCGVIGTYRGQPQPHAAFAGMVSRLDRDVGRILDRLAALGLDQNTIVLFTSDNGPHVEGGADPGFFESNGPLRGLKRDLYEGGIRVPMIAWGPGLVPQQRISDHPWGNWDLLATLTELAGVTAPATNGLSMAGLLRENGPVPVHRYLYWEFDNVWGGHYVQAIRNGDWKLLRFRETNRSWDELYNLHSDIGEYNNLANRYPDIVDRLVQLIANVRIEP